MADVLLREAAVGLILWTGAAQVAKMRLAFHPAAISVTFLWTRRFGLMRPMIRKVTLMESMLLHLGGTCFSNLVRACGLWLGPMMVTRDAIQGCAQHMQEQH